jgi:hypothetical protein
MDDPRIIMEFVGGSEDGSRYENTVQARVYYWGADHGRVGSRFLVIPEGRFIENIASRKEPPFFEAEHYEVYEIAERRDEWDHVYVRAEYLGRENSIPVMRREGE